MDDYDLPIGRRKFFTGLASLTAGSAAAGLFTLVDSDDEVYNEQDELCYLTDDKDLEGETASLFVQHRERENEFRQINTALEPNGEGEIEACVSLEEFDDETYDRLSHVKINGEKVWEGNYSVS